MSRASRMSVSTDMLRTPQTALPRLPGWRRPLVLTAVGDGLAHRRVCLDVLHAVVVHDAEVALAERLSHRPRHFRLRLDDPCPHLLLERDRHRAALFCLCLRDLLVRVRLVDL